MNCYDCLFAQVESEQIRCNRNELDTGIICYIPLSKANIECTVHSSAFLEETRYSFKNLYEKDSYDHCGFCGRKVKNIKTLKSKIDSERNKKVMACIYCT